MATAKLTPLQELEARAMTAGPKRVISEEEKATRVRVAKAKGRRPTSGARWRAGGAGPSRAKAIWKLNEPKQPDDAQFEALIEAPFKAPPKKKTNDRRF